MSNAFLTAIGAITKRADAILKEGEAPAGDGPTASDVHVPSADMMAGPHPHPNPKKKPKRAKGEANG